MAVPLPLIIIGQQVGVPEEDIWQIKTWTDAWVQRLGMMQTEDEERWSVEQEIEAQHYFQPIFERLRKQPDDTLLSELVNRVIPEWGRPLNDNELHAEMMADTFVGGSETTTNAIAYGVKLLIEQPEVWVQLKSDPDKYLRTFCEEVLRLEGPVQGLLRWAANDFELHGVTIPKGATVNVRYAAANRDSREFECPGEVNLERENRGGTWPSVPACTTVSGRRWRDGKCTGPSGSWWNGSRTCVSLRAKTIFACSRTSCCARLKRCTSNSTPRHRRTSRA